MKRAAALILIALAACNNNAEKDAPQSPLSASVSDSIVQNPSAPTGNFSNAVIEIKTFSNNGAEVPAGFGYDIVVDGKLYIHQPHIPALSGNRAFTSEAEARRTGELVAFKIRNNIMPPALTTEELDSLGIH